MIFTPHSDKQERALFGFSDHGFSVTATTTGIQWGKTSCLALWMKMRMFEHPEPGYNFIITSPSYPIFAQSTLPPFLATMDGLGRFDKKDNCFILNYGGREGARCWFRTGTNPDSIVGITNVMAIGCDEAGLYSLYFWENIQGRASFKSAPIYIATSPYSLNWLYKEIVRPKSKDPEARPDVLWIHARSDENPYFPKKTYEARKKTMDPRRFNMMFGGRFDKMEGLVYMGFSEATNVIPRRELPQGTRIVAGVDWGTTHPFVITPRAITPDGYHYKIGEFYKTGLDVFGMIRAASQMKANHYIEMFYCDPARPDLISAFNSAGLKATGANNEIIKGIEVHRDLINSRKLLIFEGECPHTIDEYETYRYPSPKDLRPDQDDKDPLPVDKDNHCCFTGDMMVETSKGLTPIKKVKVGDKVMTPLGFRKVLKSGPTGYKKVCRYEFDNGKVIVSTPDHPFATMDGWKMVNGFIGTEFIGCQTISSLMAKSIDAMALIGYLLVVVRGVGKAFIGLCGSFITALFLKDTTSITRITIKAITLLRIWSLCQQLSTLAIMGKLRHQTRSKRGENIWKPLGRKHLLGTDLRKVANGIQSMPGYKQIIGFSKTLLVYIANHYFEAIHFTYPNIVRTIVRVIIVSRVKLITSLVNVPIVGKISKRINTLEPSLVRVLAAQPLPEKQKVFNLKVDGGCFFVEGMLVSNCDSDRYVSIMTHQITSVYKKPSTALPANPREMTHDQRIEWLKRRTGRNHSQTETW